MFSGLFVTSGTIIKLEAVYFQKNEWYNSESVLFSFGLSFYLRYIKEKDINLRCLSQLVFPDISEKK